MNMMPLFLGDVAGSEIVVILIVILLFFGSKSIPGIAKTMGQAMYQIRNASNEELNIKSILKETQEQLVQPLDQMYSDVENSVHYTGRPKTPIEKAAMQDEEPALEESSEAEATIVAEEKNIEPNKPVE